jgi:hypothetical protein
VFKGRVEDSTIKIQLLLGEKTVNKAFRQAFELQAVLLADRPPPQNNHQNILGELIAPTGQRDQ